MAGAKKVVEMKNQFFHVINHMKEFLKSLNTGVVFLHFLPELQMTAISPGMKFLIENL